MKESFNNLIENNSVKCLIIMFILGLVFYWLIASFMTNPIYLHNDEELYVNMARSFFFEHNFSREYGLVSYNCVLYSVILSISYFFYSPENITFIMRMIGTTLMVSCVFPSYLLAKDVFSGNKKKGLFIALITLIIPEMISGVYLIQENLSYPLFLWITYFIYRKFKENKQKTTLNDIMIIILLTLIFFTKSYTIVFSIAYFLGLLIISIKEKEYKNIKNIVIQGLIFIIFVVAGLVLVKAVNNFQESPNHYTGQISSIFPLNLEKIGYMLYGIFCYIVFWVFSSGILPVLVPILNIKSYEEKDRKLLLILTLSAILTLIEVAMIVFIPEEGGKAYPYKICVRYLALFTIPYLIMFMKINDKEFRRKKVICAYTIISTIYLILYFLRANRNTTLMDAYVFTVLQFLDAYLKYVGVIAVRNSKYICNILCIKWP